MRFHEEQTLATAQLFRSHVFAQAYSQHACYRQQCKTEAAFST